MLRGIDLGGGEIAARFQFFGIELCDRLAGVQLIAFLREYLFDSPAHSRSNVHLVDFDRAGDCIGIAVTADECRREYERDDWPQNGRNLQNAASLAITRREVEGDAMAGYSGTPLVRKARSLGLRTVDGWEVLLSQGAISFLLWTGQSAPLEAMRETLKP